VLEKNGKIVRVCAMNPSKTYHLDMVVVTLKKVAIFHDHIIMALFTML
jgi:hypothetical protein